MSLRKDTNQWMIYEEEAVRAATGAIEIYLMLVGGAVFTRKEDIALRAMGHIGMRIGTTRLELWEGKKRGLESNEVRQELAGYLRDIMAWQAGEAERPDQALDELHAVMVWLDKRTNAAGVNGEGWYREVIRESQSGR